MSTTYTIRVLHISDAHFRSSEGPLPEARVLQVQREAWKRHRVLGDAWLKNLDEVSADGRPVDIVCFTGDVADWGLSQEYTRATDFMKDVLAHLQLNSSRLFIVPGNHDIHRNIEPDAWSTLRQAAAQVSASTFSEWIAGGSPPFRVEPGLRDAVLKRSDAYHEWVERGLDRPELLPARSPHRRLGYHQKIELPSRPFPIHIIGLDSAWLAGDENDVGKLRVTEDQVGILTADGSQPLSGFRIALIHHPLTDLADGAEIRRLLAERVDLLLRGHQHDPLTEMWADPERRLLELAAGCLYEGSEGHRHPNAFQVIDIITNESGRPIRYEVWFRGWSPRGGYWHNDSSLYRAAREGRLTLNVTKHELDNSATSIVPPRNTAIPSPPPNHPHRHNCPQSTSQKSRACSQALLFNKRQTRVPNKRPLKSRQTNRVHHNYSEEAMS
jgi:predicted MPP superfamily phosphohydrolase